MMASSELTTGFEAVTVRPTELFEMQEPLRTQIPLGLSTTDSPIPNTTTTNTTANNADDDDNNQVYPTGAKRWLALSSLLFGAALHGLDLTIVAAAIPSLTNDFHTLDDIEWYSSAYSLMAASFSFFFGRLYTLTAHSAAGGTKWTYLAALCVFELGSLLCTVAPTSGVFILGRAVAGVGASGIGSGGAIIVARLFPRSERPLWTTAVGAAQMLGIVSSAIVGGALIDWLGTWRGCFGVNLPLGALAIVFIVFGFKGNVGVVGTADVAPVQEGEAEREGRTGLFDITRHPRQVQTGFVATMNKAYRIFHEFDILGTFLMLPAVTCFLLALQYGSSSTTSDHAGSHGVNINNWSSPRVIALLVVSAGLLAGFAYRQHSIPESRATLPPRIAKMRSVLAGAWFTACTNATLAVTEYYVTIYFQGVKGLSAMQSGVMMLPMLIGIMVGGLTSGVGITRLGWYNPFMITTTLLAPIAAGLLTTFGLDDPDAKVPALLGFLGIAVGLGIQTPTIALQTAMKPADLPMGIALLGFGATMGNAVWIVVSAALFQGRLDVEIAEQLGSTATPGGVEGGTGFGNETLVQTILTGEVGLSEIREVIGADRLRDVLLGYDEALTQTMYLPLALTLAMVLGCVFTEWRSVKKKQT